MCRMMNVRPAAQSPDSVFYRENPINIPHWGKGDDFAPLLTHILFIQHRIVASRKERRAEERGRGGIKNAESDMHINNIKKHRSTQILFFPLTNNSIRI